MKNKGLLVVISGAAGTGKGTVVNQLKQDDAVRVSVSATTRSPRAGEKNGEQYHFVTRETFLKMIEENGFLEYAEYVGNFYGSPKKQAEEWMEEGKDVILEIEVQGCQQVKRNFPSCISIFILPPSMEVLEQRLRNRGTETEEVILQRLARAKEEIPLSEEYDYVVVNDRLEDCVAEIKAILQKEKSRKISEE